MSRFQINKLKVDFNETAIENLFLETYLPLANEIQLKTYIYGLKLAQEDREIDDEELAKFLGVSLSDIEDAWNFWKDLDLIDIKDLGASKIYEYKSVRFLYLGLYDKYGEKEATKELTSKDNIFDREDENILSKDGNAKFSVSPDQLSDMYKAIEDYISLDQPVHISLDPKDIRILNDLVYSYELDPFFVSYAYHMASEANEFKSKNPPYVSKVIERWVKYENIRSVDELDKYIEKRSKVEEKKEQTKRTINRKKENRPKNVYNDQRYTKEERRAMIKKKLKMSRE